MTREQVLNLVTVARFAAVETAHELRRDLERGVFSRGTLAIIAITLVVTIVAFVRGEIRLAVASVAFAALMTYAPARADRRWRDETRQDP